MAEKLKILIAEDRSEDRRLLRKMLESMSYNVQEAVDGQEGLDMARLHKPDLIISDALMPRMDGFRFLRNIKKDKDLKDIFFIFYSAVYAGNKDEKLALSLGARAFIEKPTEPAVFIEKLKSIIQNLKLKKEAEPVELIDREEEYLKSYSDIVATKLEEKVVELENINESLQQQIIKRKQAEEALQKAHDELERRVAERTSELTQANIKLQELDRLKYMFIANMSHELRTPLNSIIGFTGIILMGMAGEIAEEQRKQLTMVKNSANHLLALINDVIDVSKIEAGKVELAIGEFDLSALVREVEESFKTNAAEKGLKLLLKMPEKLVIKSDERRTKQVIMNFVSNAVKFTDKGEIEIKAAKKDGRAEILVRDTGIGIRKKDLKKLFKAFSRIQVEGTPMREGTGLGLYLSKRIADLLGGNIQTKSEFGKGSVFTFRLPLL